MRTHICYTCSLFGSENNCILSLVPKKASVRPCTVLVGVCQKYNRGISGIIFTKVFISYKNKTTTKQNSVCSWWRPLWSKCPTFSLILPLLCELLYIRWEKSLLLYIARASTTSYKITTTYNVPPPHSVHTNEHQRMLQRVILGTSKSRM